MHDYGGLSRPLAGLCLLVMAVLLGITWCLVSWLVQQVPLAVQVWLLPCAFAAVEAARQLPPYRFPWNPTAAVVAHLPWALGSLPVWGATGLGWAIIAIGAAGWGLMRQQTRRSSLALLGAVCLLLVTASLLAPRTQPSGAPVTVAVLQPGTTLEQRWDPANAEGIADTLWQLTTDTLSQQPHPELILWPEGAVPYILDRDPLYQRRVSELCRTHRVWLVLNSIGFTNPREYTNAAYLVDTSGSIRARYDKVRLVPFGEYVPMLFRNVFTESLVREVGSFSAGTSLAPLPGPSPIGVTICYEVVFADLVASEVRNGAQLLATITNDGWYGFSWAPAQHFAQCVLRAVESRRWLARAALTGISGFVDPRGVVTRHLDVGQSGSLVERLQPSTGVTPRSRWGDWWGALCGIACITMVLVARRRRPPATAHS